MKNRKIRMSCPGFLLALALCLCALLPFAETAHAASVRLNAKKKTLTAGQTYKLSVKGTKKKAKWKSGSPKTASVSPKGVVTAKKAGTAVISAKIGRKKLTCKITVKKAAAADEVIALANKERARRGIKALKKNALLDRAAKVRAKELARRFSHDRPNGESCFTAISPSYRYRLLGENIAAGYTGPDAVMEGWMHSPGHKANILNGGFDEIGVAVYEKNGTKYWVQMFGSRY